VDAVAVATAVQSERRATAGEAAEVLCACAGLTRTAAAERLAAQPEQSFEQFLSRTGAGQDCTACMLDLEYFFVEAPRQVARAAADMRAAQVRRGLKQRLYAFLDSLPPKLAFNRSNWMPVLAGGGVQQFLWMANYPLLFGEPRDMADFGVRFVVRDAAGTVVHRGRARLPVNGVLRHDLSQYLPASKGENFAIGSAQVDRYALRPAARGTTRPQTELVMRSSASSLHFQAATPRYDEYLSIPAGREDETHFLSVLNCAARPFRLTVERRGRAAAPTVVELGPHQARLLEVSAPREPGEGDLATLHLRSEGLGKLHLVIFNRRLDRVSFDHL
jgi:bacterioferritin-associated ferredoxin